MGVISSNARGREFEAEIAAIFRRAGFEVIENPKAAKPRQSDLYVRGDDGIDILIEAKNEKRKVDIGHIDALRSRLNRVSATVVGAIFTTSELTKSAVDAIRNDRRREILAFVGTDLDALRSGEENMRALLERKRTALRVQGEVWIASGKKSLYGRVPIPASAIEYRVGDAASAYFESKSGLGAAFYSMALPDPGWGSISGEGARLRIDPVLSSTKDLRNIFAYLHEKFGLSRNGAFSIQQSQCCWNGSGAEELLNALDNWRERYTRSPSKEFHHSEEFRYFDEFRDGWLEISAQQRIGRERAGGCL